MSLILDVSQDGNEIERKKPMNEPSLKKNLHQEKYRLFHNMKYKNIRGLWQLTIVVDERFGYVGITNEQYEELKKLENETVEMPKM